MKSPCSSALLHHVKILFIRMVLLTVLLGVVALACLNFFGLPKPVLRRVLSAVSRGDVAFGVEAAKLNGLTEIRLKNVSIYSKHVIGKPLMSAPSVLININPLEWFSCGSGIKGVRVYDGYLHPRQLKISPVHHRRFHIRQSFSFPLELRRCHLYDITMPKGTCIIGLHGGKVLFSSIDATLVREGLSGKAGGNISYDLNEKKLRCDLVSYMEPAVIMTVFKECKWHPVVLLLNRFGFNSPNPRVKWKIDVGLGSNKYAKVSGEFRLRDCSYRGVAFERADGLFSMDIKKHYLVVKLERLFVVNKSGLANVSFVAEPYNHQLDFVADSTLNILDTARMVGVLTNFLEHHVQFAGPSSVSAKGHLDYNYPHTRTAIKGEVKADDVTVFGLKCDSGSFDMHMSGKTFHMTNIVASAYDGFVSGNLTVEAPEKQQHSGVPCSLNLSLRDANYDKLMRNFSTKFNDSQQYQGKIAGVISIACESGKDIIKSLNGKGQVHINHGRVFMLPVFGGLSKFMVKLIPGLGFVLSQNDAKCKFMITNGKIHTDKFTVNGDVLSLKGKGSYDIGKDLDFYVQVKLMQGKTLGGKFFRALTYPLSKLFEFKVHGPISEPSWYPVNFSFDVFRRMKSEAKEIVE